MFLSCATSSLSQGGKHFKALKGLETMSLSSFSVRAAPYLHRHSDAASLVTLPDGFHAAPAVPSTLEILSEEAWLIP